MYRWHIQYSETSVNYTENSFDLVAFETLRTVLTGLTQLKYKDVWENIQKRHPPGLEIAFKNKALWKHTLFANN